MADESVTLEPLVVQYDPVTGVPSEFNEYLPKDCDEYKRYGPPSVNWLSRYVNMMQVCATNDLYDLSPVRNLCCGTMLLYR